VVPSLKTFERTIVTTNDGLRQAVAYCAATKLVGVDTETCDPSGRPMEEMGALDFHRNAIRLVQLAAGDRSYIIDLFEITDVRPLMELMMDPNVLKIGQNLKFECGNFLKHWGVWIENCFDTMIASRFFQRFVKRFPETGEYPTDYSSSERRHNLAAIAARFLNVDLSKAEQASDWGVAELSREQIEYAFLDAEIMLPLYTVLSAMLDDAGLRNAAWIEFRAIPAMAEMELAGWYVDRKHLDRIGDEIEERVARLRAGLTDVFPARQQGLFAAASVNLDSPKQLQRAILERFEVDLESTDKRALLAWRSPTDEMIREQLSRKYPLVRQTLIDAWRDLHADLPEIVDMLVDYSSLAKLSGQVDAIAKEISPVTGRVHPDIIQMGQDQHRTANRKPNTSQVPRPDTYGHASRWHMFRSEMNFREAFQPAEGARYAICDFASNQLRIVADQSGDRMMIAEFNRDDADIYRATAAAILNKPRDQVTKPERQAAKVWVLSFSFAVGAGTYMKQKLEDTREYTSLEQCRREREAFFAIYPALRRWHSNQVELVKHAHAIHTPIGRKIFFHPECAKAGLIYTEAINFPICATEVDGSRLAIGQLFRMLKKSGYRAKIIGFIYDEIVIEVDERDAEEVSAIQQKVMRESMQKVLRHVPAKVEGSIGTNWAAK
jgi:DNA polymerase-1